VSKRPRPTILVFIYGGSILLHGAFAVGALLLPKSTTKEAVAIELREAKKAKEPPKPPPPAPPPPPTAEKPKPPPPPVAQAQAKVAPEAKTEAAPPMPVGADGYADLGGLALGNADGPGLAVPGAAAAATTAAPAATTATATTHKVQQLAASQTTDMCVEPVVRPKRKVPVVPKYTMEARQAEIEGVVRVEVTIDETGQVVNARVVSGLGYGLDDAALVAARASTFEPATRCKKPVIGTTILPFRFQET
jgi:protein TonB